jgi:ABC-type uncharacterized transport system permease subunit
MFATPLIWAALGETVGQKSGVVNIGLEGIMLLAAYVAAVVSLSTGSPTIGRISILAFCLLYGGPWIGSGRSRHSR